MEDDFEKHFLIAEDPDNPGWRTWAMARKGTFNEFLGKMMTRDGAEMGLPGKAVVRIVPEAKHLNMGDMVHGGVIMAFADISLFAGGYVLGLQTDGPSITLDMQTQFVSAAVAGVPLDAQVEVVRETRKLVFMRGLIVQNDQTVASYSGMIKKIIVQP